MLYLSAFLPPERQYLLHRPVGEAKQHGLGRGMVIVSCPGWYNKNVARLPTERRVADYCAALALNNRVNRAVCGSIRRGGEAIRQQRHKCPDGRHWRAAR